MHGEVGEEEVGAEKIPTKQAWLLGGDGPFGVPRSTPTKCQSFFPLAESMCLLKCKFLEKSNIRLYQSLAPLSREVCSHRERRVGRTSEASGFTPPILHFVDEVVEGTQQPRS